MNPTRDIGGIFFYLMHIRDSFILPVPLKAIHKYSFKINVKI